MKGRVSKSNVVLESQTKLAKELRITLSRRMALAAFCITVLATGLHLGWSLHQRAALENHLRDALAHSLQEPLRAHDLPAVHAILQAFSTASSGAEICVRLPGGDWLKVPRCGSAPFEAYTLNLSKDQFEVSVTLPMLDRMVLFGVPFGLAILVTLLLISQYLKTISKRVLDDLDRPSSSPGDATVHYQELAQAAEKIARGFQLQEENLKLAADARIGAIAELAGHDIRGPLKTLQILASEAARNLSPKRRRVFNWSMLQIEEVANDLLKVGKLASNGKSNVPVAWPPSLGSEHSLQVVSLASIVENAVEEKRISFESRPDLEILLNVEPTAQNLQSLVRPSDLGRVLSNLINNAAEAIDGKGQVEIVLRGHGESAELLVSDTGRGIPAEVLGKLMKKRESFGKENGSGLGLFHAKEKIEFWGGELQIESMQGKGTTVRLRLPLTQEMISQRPDLILIDDSPVVHESWKMFAEERDLKLAVFSSFRHFFAHSSSLSREVPIYVDKNGNEDGLEVGKELVQLGFQNLHLSTGENWSCPSPPPGFRSVVGKGFPRQLARVAT